ncbi:MAG: UDP-galactopyranose mutase, partial [bacterium]
TSVMNSADCSMNYTRIHEPRHLHPERNYTKGKTVILFEIPDMHDSEEPYYPINTDRNQNIFEKYKEASHDSNLIIGGRLGDYAYYDMDTTIEAALTCFEREIIDKGQKA